MTAGLQILTIILLLLIIKFCQISLYPYLRPALPKISYGLAYPISALAVTFISWYLGLAHLPIQLSLVPFAILLGIAIWKKQITLNDIKENAIFDIIFLAGFFLILAVRFVYPGIIVSGEKFMDAAILGSIMNNPVTPPADAWFSGEPLTVYYYLGHWMCAVFGILAFGESVVIFNVMLPLVFGLAAVAAFSIGALLLDRKRAWLPMLVLLIPSISMIVRIFCGDGIVSFLWNATRVIANGTVITEFPLFSFLWGDPHAHVLGCFNQLTFICLILVLLTKWRTLSSCGRWILAALLSLSLGTMPVMNSWDVLIYAPLYLAAAGVLLIRLKKDSPITKLPKNQVLPLILIPFASLASYGLFLVILLISGGSSIRGIGFVTTPSELLPFLGIWGFFLLIILLDGLKTLKRFWFLAVIPVVLFFFGYGSLGVALFCLLIVLLRKEKHADTFLAAAGCVILILLELIYLKDYMGPDYYRMNTVFKIGYACWFILGTSAFLMIGRWIRNRFSAVSGKRFIAGAGIVYVILIIALVTCGIGLSGGAGGTLDGSAWLTTQHPDDAAGISWLKEHASASDRVAEAVGNSYTYASRVSVMTGLATPLGWTGHESGWRSGIASVDTVMNEVREMYENPTATIPLMKKYRITYLFVGEVEHDMYQVSLPQDGLKQVFSSGDTAIYQLA